MGHAIRYCACGRKILVLPHPKRNPKSRARHVRLPEHDCCRQCFKRLISQARAEQDERDRQEKGGRDGEQKEAESDAPGPA